MNPRFGGKYHVFTIRTGPMKMQQQNSKEDDDRRLDLLEIMNITYLITLSNLHSLFITIFTAMNGNTATATTINIPKPRRSKRQQDAIIGTRRSQRTFKRRHSGTDARIYGEDYGILPSD